MPVCYIVKDRKCIKLSSSDYIDGGGEGDIYSWGKYAIKIYNKDKLNRERKEKIYSVCQQKYYETERGVLFPIFPVYSCRRYNIEDIIGFAMNRATDYSIIFNAINPKQRDESFSHITLREGIEIAIILVKLIDKIHQNGIVIGDINESGFMIKNGISTPIKDNDILAIDADSFQYTIRGRTYYCRVGTGDYTPPELQGKDFGKGVRREASSDLFGMAVMLFRLLHDGRHPFEGTYKGSGITPEKAIRKKLYAYVPNNGMKPTFAILKPDHYPREIRLAFLRAFTCEPHDRPSAQEWQQLLAKVRIIACQDGHHYPASAGSCPWCKSSSKGASRPSSASKGASRSSSARKGKTGTGQTRSRTQPHYPPRTPPPNPTTSNISWGWIATVMISLFIFYNYLHSGENREARTLQKSSPSSSANYPQHDMRQRLPQAGSVTKVCLPLSRRSVELIAKARKAGCSTYGMNENEVYRRCQEQGRASAQAWLDRVSMKINACISRKKTQRLQNHCRIIVNSSWPMMTRLQKMGCITHATNREKMYNDCLRNPDSFRTLRQDLQRKEQACRRARELREEELRRQKEYACKGAVASVQRLLKRINELGCRMRRNIDWNFLFQTCMNDPERFRKLQHSLRQRVEECRQRSKATFVYRWVRGGGRSVTQWRAVSRPVCILDRNCDCPRKANNCRTYRPGERALYWPNGCSLAAVIAECEVARRR